MPGRTDCVGYTHVPPPHTHTTTRAGQRIEMSLWSACLTPSTPHFGEENRRVVIPEQCSRALCVRDGRGRGWKSSGNGALLATLAQAFNLNVLITPQSSCLQTGWCSEEFGQHMIVHLSCCLGQGWGLEQENISMFQTDTTKQSQVPFPEPMSWSPINHWERVSLSSGHS